MSTTFPDHHARRLLNFEPDPAEARKWADDHLAALGVTHTPRASVEVERLTIRSEGDLLTFYAADNEVTHQLREGGVDGAQHTEYGSVVVMLGIDGNLMTRVELDD